jgi:ABC-type multidrug transport system fused ATPase/permease subunit
VQAALNRLIHGPDSAHTSIVVAHRLSTIRNANVIVVLAKVPSTAVVCCPVVSMVVA